MTIQRLIGAGALASTILTWIFFPPGLIAAFFMVPVGLLFVLVPVPIINHSDMYKFWKEYEELNKGLD